MDSMEWLLFTKYSIHAFSQFILSLIIAVYLATVREKSRATRALTLFFVAFTGAMGFEFLVFSTARPWGFYMGFIQGVLLFVALGAMLLFAYRFPENRHPQESRWALGIVGMINTGTVTSMFCVTYWLPGLEHFLLLSSLVMTLNVLWIAAVFARKTMLFSAEAQADDRPAWRHFWRARGRQAKALRGFCFLIVVWLLVSSSLTLESVGSISMDLLLGVMTLGILFFLFAFVLLYVNSATEPTSFNVKLVGISLVAMLVTMGDLGTFVAWRFTTAYREERLREAELVRRAVVEDDFGSIPEAVLCVDAHSLRDVERAGEELFTRFAEVRPDFYREYVGGDFARRVVEQLRGEGELEPNEAKVRATRQMNRSSLIQLQQRYGVGGLVPERLKFAVYYFIEGERLYAVIYPFDHFARYLHPHVRGLIVFIGGTALFILAFFPLFFRSGLVRPLQNLLGGMERVDDGDLEVEVEVHVADEIGYLTRSFNDMVRSIREGKRQLSQYAEELAENNRTLEQRVEERTRDLQEKNEELEETLRTLREMQNQLLLQEKMASLGGLVAGVAHEINNPIGAVNGAADVAVRCVGRIETEVEEGTSIERLRESRRFRQALGLLRQNSEVTLEAGGRVARIVDSLKNFAQLDEAEFQMTDVHEGIESALTLLQHQVGEGIEVVRDLGEVELLYCSPGQLNQVFMNVIKNAAQAIDGEGRIDIRTRQEEGEVRIDIRDTGKGIDPERLRRIFDVDFNRGSGRVRMGTGLSLAYRIAQEHGGRIEIDSEPGRGTEVRIALPVRRSGEG